MKTNGKFELINFTEMVSTSGVFDVQEQTHSAISIQMPMTQQSEVLQSAFNGS